MESPQQTVVAENGFNPSTRPKLRENVWHVYPDSDVANLITPQMVYNVPAYAANAFLRMRSFCTGHNSIAEIARKSHLSVEDVIDCLNSLRPSGIVYEPDEPDRELTRDEIRELLVKVSQVWANELKMSY